MDGSRLGLIEALMELGLENHIDQYGMEMGIS